MDKVPPRTSQPSPQSFMTIFEDAKENGDQVIAILISSNLSGTCLLYTSREALAEKQSRLMGRQIDPNTEIVTTCGSTEACLLYTSRCV